MVEGKVQELAGNRGVCMVTGKRGSVCKNCVAKRAKPNVLSVAAVGKVAKRNRPQTCGSNQNVCMRCLRTKVGPGAYSRTSQARKETRKTQHRRIPGRRKEGKEEEREKPRGMVQCE